MLAPRRIVSLLLVGLATVPTPACLHLAGSQAHTEPAEPKAPSSGDFAIFPKRPGEVVRMHTGASAVASKPTAPTEPTTDPKTDTVVPIPPIADANLVRASDSPIGIPSATEPALLAAMRAYLENRPDDAIRLLQPLDRANQDYALALMPLLVRGTQLNMAAANPEDVSVLVEQLHAIAGRLAAKAALKVDKVAFCRKINGFAQYEPWPLAQPYKPNDLAHLYVEVRNVGCVPASGPHGETYLSRAVVSLEVRDANQKLVEQTDLSDWRRRVTVARVEYADYTHSPLHDYFRTYRIQVPAQPGVYTVTVEVRDPAGQRVARSQPAEFRVVAGP